MLREMHKRKPRKAEKTKGLYRGGLSRSTAEVSVMEMEGRA